MIHQCNAAAMFGGTFIASGTAIATHTMHPSNLRSRLLVALCATTFPLQVVGAQLTAPSAAPDTAHGAPLFNGRDAIRAVGFAGLTVAMFPLDRSIARRL